ncbi:hypothetical protein [Shouchella shacheensis]|uniref:hypothetical protein n=1 Tax=Shouchella shacheensis TaxID=1649580 RepID=UPI00073FF243|nr:hypothetical protein [Shouchella shacheensis]
MPNFMRWAVPTVIVLAIIGIAGNPALFFQRLLFLVFIGALIFFAYRFYVSKKYGAPFLPKRSGPSREQLRRAKHTSTTKRGVKQKSGALSGPSKQAIRNSRGLKKAPKRRSGPQLTVIEGSKSKQKSKNKKRA